MSTSAVTASTARSELYVDITRGRHSNQLYATRTDPSGDTDAEPHLPTLPAAVVDSLTERLARGHEPTALTQAPRAIRVEQHRHGRNLAGLHAARRRTNDQPDPLLDAAINRAARAVHRIGVNQPDPTLTSRLSRPNIPHLAARWDQLAGDIAVHNATAARHTNPTDTTLEGPDADEIATRLAALAADITLRQLDEHIDPTSVTAGIVRMRPGWLTHHLEQRFNSTGVAGIDLDQLAGLVDDVHAWRIEHHLIGHTADDQPLGPTPDSDIERAHHRALTHRLNRRRRPRSGSRSIA